MDDVLYTTIALTAQLGAIAMTLFTSSALLESFVDNISSGEKEISSAVRGTVVVSSAVRGMVVVSPAVRGMAVVPRRRILDCTAENKCSDTWVISQIVGGDFSSGLPERIQSDPKTRYFDSPDFQALERSDK